MECVHCRKYESNKESGLCDNCEKEESNKINGLLYLPALGIIISAVLMPVSLSFHLTQLSQELPTGIAYYLYGAIFILSLDVIITYFTAWTFFKKKKFIKKVIVPYYILGATNAVYFSIFASYILDIKPSTSEMSPLISAAVGIFIWIPYFLFSKRIPMVFHK